MTSSTPAPNPDNAPDTSSAPDDTVTIGELEDRSNRNSWRFMYVFITFVVLLFVVMGIAAYMGQYGS